MAVTVQFYKSAKDYLGDGALNLNTADLRMVPMPTALAFNQAHDFLDDIAASEVTSNGAARKALAGETWALSGNNGRFDCDDILQTAAGGTLTFGKYALVDYTGRTSDADTELLALFDLGGDASAPAGFDVALQTPNGLFELQ
ncbi:MAG TPA: hypothetical protein VEC14_10445 [Reyranellaceae bacterium]|nr:hypothetical protein [Reyranellaceae bacterium]